jgi:hypothetical protein
MLSLAGNANRCYLKKNKTELKLIEYCMFCIRRHVANAWVTGLITRRSAFVFNSIIYCDSVAKLQSMTILGRRSLWPKQNTSIHPPCFVHGPFGASVFFDKRVSPSFFIQKPTSVQHHRSGFPPQSFQILLYHLAPLIDLQNRHPASQPLSLHSHSTETHHASRHWTLTLQGNRIGLDLLRSTCVTQASSPPASFSFCSSP